MRAVGVRDARAGRGGGAATRSRLQAESSRDHLDLIDARRGQQVSSSRLVVLTLMMIMIFHHCLWPSHRRRRRRIYKLARKAFI